MGGQDGYQSDLLSNSTQSDSAVVGFRVHLTEKAEIGMDLAYTNSKQGMSPFDLHAPSYEETHASTSFDFSESYLYSQTDVNRFDLSTYLNYKLSGSSWLNFSYRLADYDDAIAYFQDYSGTYQIIGAYMGWNF